ncbi:type VI immunity family protein [Cystobacter fuscus]
MNSEPWPHIRIYSERGLLVLRDGFSITLYTRHSHAQIAEGALRSLELYLNAVEPGALGLYADLDGYWQNLDSTAWKLIRDELRHPTQAHIELADASAVQARYRFTYHGSSFTPLPFIRDTSTWVSAMSCWLPTEYLKEHGFAHVRELVMEMASCFPFCSGHAGLSLHAQSDILSLEKVSRARANRYPGMDIARSALPTLDIGTRVDGVHWLNFLGPPVLDALGGIAGLRVRLHSPDITVQEMEEGRAVVILGAHPDAGDLEEGRTLPAYRELARVLEPFLYQRRYLPNEEVPEELRRWERRFLD